MIIKKIYMKFIHYMYPVFWYFQFIRLKIMNKKEKLTPINSSGKTLILVPHADDELIGCYKFIKTFKNNCILCFFSYTGYDKSIKNKIIRENEFVKFCDFMNVNYRILKENNIKSELEMLIDIEQPENIMLPSIFDWHWEHRKINEILFKTKINNLNIIWYQITIPIPQEIATSYLELTKEELKEKYRVFSCIYKSQYDMPIKRLQYSERIEGEKVEKYAVEKYAYMPLKKWKSLVLLTNYNQLDIYIKYINNIVKIRKEINNWFYNISRCLNEKN